MTIMHRVLMVLDSTTVELALRLAAIVALCATAFIGIQQQQQRECLDRYAAESAQSQKARAAAAEIDRQAVDGLMLSVAQNPRQAFTAITDYNTARQAANAQRAENPIPDPPATVCRGQNQVKGIDE